MTKTRNNHYVPQWYQQGFFEPGQNTYSYLNLSPPQHTLPDGRVVTEKSSFVSPTSRAFCQRDLYSTFFGTSVVDEIERKLFGDIDTRGAHAVRAFAGEDAGEWRRHFTTFFEYLDIQKIRTPKGLDWLSAQYPRLTQNDLMFEMQGIRMMHCTIWVEGVREIVSAQDAEVKFIVSDHPVTIYNYAVPPGAIAYPNEPSIASKGSQTIFPLNRDFCLILTNLEYAEDHSANPLEKRTFAGNYRNSIVRTDALIRTRMLTSDEVIRINRVLKARAKRYIAAGKEEWLHPDMSSAEPWADLRDVFLPPKNGLWHFGGEMYASFESGEVYYQDAFGRTEKEREFLKKESPAKPPHVRALCGCGSGRAFGVCCERKPVALRPTWVERSIRERNLMLFNGISEILGITQDRDWVTVRREITDEKIRHAYGVYSALWPRDTNLLAMLPKPDGAARAIYTGVLHPSAISRCALGLSLYFDELLIEHPFLHPETVNKKLSPLEHPKMYRQEFLKSVILFTTMMPLVERGLVTLFPDPCNFDFHLRNQMFEMAQVRTKGLKVDPEEEAGFMEMMKEEHKRAMLLLPREALRRQVLRDSPELNKAAVEAVLDGFERLRQQDPLAVLQEGSLEDGEDGGQLTPFKMAPNFEIAMYLAQATGSCIVTDSVFRWRELTVAAQRGRLGGRPLTQLRASMEQANFAIPWDVQEISTLAERGAFDVYPKLMRKILRYLSALPERGSKPNFEASVNAEFGRIQALKASIGKKSTTHLPRARISCLWPAGGIQDNTVNRLLLMSSSEHHLSSVPMALFVER
ncbi:MULTISPECIES: DUF4238 domain-containing protein [unclassified Mesorhizobium]|uniref:DUF4238 domain-containing protein n=1 Tax=unclassified Mesorhizobium TaxID=325217 RepID=UPI000FD716AB|nr:MULTISPECIES: DUF4238 domain-containing protein [unclassified Mesorhizobium]TGQ08696.1 DUF4238 domain-containing protein [Mesorhizobium sp. M2E.F.Ca.ET.219.01.1.1]TGT69231.1 DUF4238 domain-containing protein [Mesorhizobium sp. M2E.F.Ca.ET.166.01.1.1]TGW01563.1 DUF4238 domain-containing protein [Mesorhizobium sp. M2E.F.Ca.ET.154.01.1.1]